MLNKSADKEVHLCAKPHGVPHKTPVSSLVSTSSTLGQVPGFSNFSEAGQQTP